MKKGRTESSWMLLILEEKLAQMLVVREEKLHSSKQSKVFNGIRKNKKIDSQS